MHLCLVTGAIVATQKADRLHSRRLLTIERIDLTGAPTGRPEEVALDPGLEIPVYPDEHEINGVMRRHDPVRSERQRLPLPRRGTVGHRQDDGLPARDGA